MIFEEITLNDEEEEEADQWNAEITKANFEAEN